MSIYLIAGIALLEIPQNSV